MATSRELLGSHRSLLITGIWMYTVSPTVAGANILIFMHFSTSNLQTNSRNWPPTQYYCCNMAHFLLPRTKHHETRAISRLVSWWYNMFMKPDIATGVIVMNHQIDIAPSLPHLQEDESDKYRQISENMIWLYYKSHC